MKTKILKIVLLGNLILHTPFAISFILCQNYINELYRIKFYFIVILFGFIYWSIFTPWYKLYSINKIETLLEYKLWKKASIFTLLFWSDKNYFTKLELWKTIKFNLFNEKRKILLNNE